MDFISKGNHFLLLAAVLLNHSHVKILNNNHLKTKKYFLAANIFQKILEIKLLPISERAVLVQPVLHFLNMRIVANGSSIGIIGSSMQSMCSGQDFITRVSTRIRVVVFTFAIRLPSEFVMTAQ